MMLCFRIPSSGELCLSLSLTPLSFERRQLSLCPPTHSARRNQHGYLEPDADADAIQESLGFGGYENLPAKTGASTEVGAGQKLV